MGKSEKEMYYKDKEFYEVTDHMKRVLTLLLCFAMSLSLFGCGLVGQEPDSPAAEATPQPAAAEVPEAVPEEEEIPVDPRPEVMRVITRSAANLDPAGISGGNKNCLLEIYEPLFELAPDGSVRCILADETRGGKGGYDVEGGAYTVYLREGITDQDGNPLTAADAAFCVKRLAEAEGWDVFTSAEAGENGALTVKFSRALSGSDEWEKYFGHVYLYTEKAYGEHGGFLSESCGTGPYVLAEHNAESMALLPCESYWQGEVAGGRGAAGVQRIEYIFEDDPVAQVIALEVGKADMADCLSYPDTEDFRGEGSYADLFRVESAWDRTNYVLIPNVDYQSIMKEQNLRLGVFYAIDNAALAEFRGAGGARACTALGNPDCAGLPDAGESYESVTPDVNGVRSYLRQASYVNEGFKLLTVEGGVSEELAVNIQTMLRPLSINAIVTKVKPEELETKLQDPKAWDIVLLTVESGSAGELWKKLWTDRVKGSYMTGFLRDANFTKALEPIATEEGRTPESLAAVQQYALEHAYAMMLLQLSRSVVVPHNAESVYMTLDGAVLPGACMYQ